MVSFTRFSNQTLDAALLSTQIYKCYKNPSSGSQGVPRGQADRRTGGQADRRTGGQADRRTGGQADGQGRNEANYPFFAILQKV
jgi:hypothetical protein